MGRFTNLQANALKAREYSRLMRELNKVVKKIKKTPKNLQACGTMCNQLKGKFKKAVGKVVLYADQIGGDPDDALTGGADNDEWKVKLSTEITKFEDLFKTFKPDEQLESIEQWIKDHKNSQGSATQQADALKSELASIRDQLTNAKKEVELAGAKGSEEVKGLRDEIAKLEREKTDLTAQLAKAKADADKVAGLEATIAELTSKIAGYEEAKKAGDLSSSEADKKIRDAEAKVAEAEKKIKETDDKYKADVDKIASDLASKISNAQKKMDEYTTRVARMQKLIEKEVSSEVKPVSLEENAETTKIKALVQESFKDLDVDVTKYSSLFNPDSIKSASFPVMGDNKLSQSWIDKWKLGSFKNDSERINVARYIADTIDKLTNKKHNQFGGKSKNRKPTTIRKSSHKSKSSKSKSKK